MADERVLGLVVVVVGVERAEPQVVHGAIVLVGPPFLTVVSGSVRPMIVDGWVNLFPEAFASKWAAKDEQKGVLQLFGPDLAKGPTVEGLLAAMDEAGIDLGVLTAGLSDPERAHRIGGYAAEDFLAIAEEHPGRFLVSATVDRAGKPRPQLRRACASWPSTTRWRWCGSRRSSSSTS